MKNNFLITANGSFSCEEIVASLRKDGNILIGTNIYEDRWVGVSHLFDHTYIVPEVSSPDYIPKMAEICKKHSVQYILPLTDIEIDVFNVHREEFKKLGVTLCISGEKSISVSRDKYKIFQTFKDDKEVSVIPTYNYTDFLQGKTKFPKHGKIIAKLYNGRSSNGLLLLNDILEIPYIADKEKYVFQPKIEGEVFTVDYVQDKFGNDFSVVRREFLRTQHGAGISVEITRSPKLQAMASFIGKKLQILGAVNIEFLFDQKNYYIMDINPRFSAGIAFSSLAGYNFVTNHIACFNNEKIELNADIKPCFAVKRYITYITKENDNERTAE